MRLIPQSDVRSLIVILSRGFFNKSFFNDASSAYFVILDICHSSRSSAITGTEEGVADFRAYEKMIFYKIGK